MFYSFDWSVKCIQKKERPKKRAVKFPCKHENPTDALLWMESKLFLSFLLGFCGCFRGYCKCDYKIKLCLCLGQPFTSNWMTRLMCLWTLYIQNGAFWCPFWYYAYKFKYFFEYIILNVNIQISIRMTI